MPTKRFYRLLLLIIILWMFANQTQVGWLYVIVSLLVGTVVMSWFLNRRGIHSISAVREIDYRESYSEGESLEIDLHLDSSSPLATQQLRLDELCPVADPEEEQFLQHWYIPNLSIERFNINYTIELYKRGIFEFPAVEMTSRFPFGIFERSNYSENLVADSGLSILVYPEVRPLARLPLLDRQPSAQMVQPRAGMGNEFLSLRQYRYGDSPRHIHWRSVARTGRLVSKEFVDETLPGMALVIARNSVGVDATGDQLDSPNQLTFRWRRPVPEELEYGQSKHTPFETAVKIAASLGDYALRRGHPLMIVDEDAPRGAVTADMLLQYLARVELKEELTFAEQIGRIQQTYVAAVLSHPTQKEIDELHRLSQRGHEILAVCIHDGREKGCNQQLYLLPTDDERIEVHQINIGEDWTDIIGGAA